MFCQNCGNKLDEKAYVCVNCGVILKKRSEMKVVKKKKNNIILGILSTVIGIFAFIFSLLLFFNDISSVGMYTEVYERILYILDYALFSILLSSVALILSLTGKRNIYSKIGLFLSFLSFFFIITEFIVAIIY